jgi:hypothetical protein
MDRSLTAKGERRVHVRSPLTPGHVHLGARLRTGSPLRVLNTSPDGMLVESPARLQPGRQVDLVLQSGSTQERAPWVVIHSRVGCIRGSSDLRYRAGLRRAAGSGYPRPHDHEPDGNKLPATVKTGQPSAARNTEEMPLSADGTRFGRQESS